MLTLSTAFERDLEIGIPLPEVYPTLTRGGVKFRRSQIIMVAGMPNACKSIFAMNLAAGCKVPTLYFSADTDDFTLRVRALAYLTGSTTEEVEAAMKHEEAKGYYLDLLSELDHIWWGFSPEPTPEDLQIELDAFVEVWGQYPELIVVDNLLNVTLDHDNEWSAMRRVMKLMAWWARTTSAAVLVLHHCQEGIEYDGPPPRKAIQGKLSQLPSLILTLAVDGGSLKVACVKNRHGKHDRSGELFDVLGINPAIMRVSDSLARVA